MTDQQTRVLSMSMTSLMVRAVLEGSAFSGEQVSAVLPLEPGLYSDQSELLLSNLHPSAELTIYGPTMALSSLEVGHITVSKNISRKMTLLNVCIWDSLGKLSSENNAHFHMFSTSSGGVFLPKHCCPGEGGAPRLPQFLKVHHQCRGPPGRPLCVCLPKQRFQRTDTYHPSHSDPRGWSQRCHARSVYSSESQFCLTPQGPDAYHELPLWDRREVNHIKSHQP